MNHTQYTELGQNRIDYIVYHNILEAQKLLYDQGFESPEDPDDIVEAIKELVRKEGRVIIEALLKIHPDKKAILAIADLPKVCERCKTKLGQSKNKGCASCSKATVPTEDNFLADPNALDDKARLNYLVGKYTSNPSKENEKEVETHWDSIRTKPKEEEEEEEVIKKEEANQSLLTKKELCIYASIFGLGMLMGLGFSYSKNS